MLIIIPSACVSKGSLNLNKPAGLILGFLVANILIVISMLKTYYFCVVKLMFLAANQIH
jgi:hypothetical protein